MSDRYLFDPYTNEPAQDARTLAKRSDPQTSHEAAAELVRSGKLGQQSQLVLEALRKHGPSTSAELAQRSGLDRHLVARRLPDLLKRGKVTRGNARPCNATGNRALVWRAT